MVYDFFFQINRVDRATVHIRCDGTAFFSGAACDNAMHVKFLIDNFFRLDIANIIHGFIMFLGAHVSSCGLGALWSNGRVLVIRAVLRRGGGQKTWNMRDRGICEAVVREPR